MMRRFVPVLVFPLILVNGLTGCGVIDMSTSDEAFQGVSGHAEKVRSEEGMDVTNLPLAEEEVANMDRLIDELSQVVDSIAPVGPWERLRSNSRFPCSVTGYEGLTRSISLRNLVSTTGVPDDKVPQVQDALVERAERKGFTFDGEFPNVPGDWDFQMSAPDGRTLRMGDGGNVLLTGDTGCRRDDVEYDSSQESLEEWVDENVGAPSEADGN